MAPTEQPVVLITGATDGLGKAVAQRLAAQGWHVLLHGRNREKGQAVAEEIQQSAPSGKVTYYNADLGSLRETAGLADAISAEQQRLDVLVNNAGIGPLAPGSPRRTSAEGYESFFAVNYLSGYLLAHALLPLLKKSAPARIINVASIGQQPIDFDNVMLEREYDDARAYRQSKLAQILFTFDLAEQLKGTGITANCLHPATLMNTGMVFNSKYFPGPKSSLDQGAEALERLIVAPELKEVSGEYFDGKEISKANDQAYDWEARQRLRELSDQLTNI